MTRIVICVPWRAGDAEREAIWDFVQGHWKQTGWPIIVEGSNQKGTFNRARAKNEAAAKAGRWDVAVFLDADIVATDLDAVRAGAERAAATGKVVIPYRTYAPISERGTTAFLAGDRAQLPRSHESKTGYVGGCVIVPRTAWETLGGYDEGFDAWGGEDNAFYVAACTLTGFERGKGAIVHLWHRVGPEAEDDHPDRKRMMERDELYFAVSQKPDAMRALLQRLHAEKSNPRIPHIFHQIWVGPKPPPVHWIEPWRRMHPAWEFRLWREADLAVIEMPNRSVYDWYMDRGIWHGAADIARVAVLLLHGGVYIDIDSRPLKPYDNAPFMRGTFFAGYEPVASLPGRVANGVIGSTADHPILRTYAELVGKLPNVAEPWDSVGATSLTAAILLHRQAAMPAIVMPERTFHSTDAWGRPVKGTDGYSEHFWATTNDSYPAGPRAVILVPRRVGSPIRERYWEYAKQSWSALGWDIIEGHHDDGPFNAAAARNTAAAKAGKWDVAVFVDGDTVMFDHEPVRKGVELAASTGQFVRPYDRYLMTNEASAASLITTGKRPASGVRPLGEASHGGVNIIPRSLWDTLGGYDERFRGWGSEDTAVELAGRMLGGFATIPGEVYHLWHPKTPDRDPSLPGFQANVALRQRYEAARTPEAMRALLAERGVGAPFGVGAVVITNGRRDCIAKTIPSLEAMVGPFAQRIICDDSGDRRYAGWLRETFPDWRVLAHDHYGHGKAVKYAMGEAANMAVDWVFSSEDDIIYKRKVDLPAMIRVMESEGSDLKQISLKRQAWFPLEKKSGSTVIDRFDPSLFTERQSPDGTWLSHRVFFTLNPHLIRRSLVGIIARQWPELPNSEQQFSTRLFRNPLPRCGIWGARTDEPWIEHFGERTGTGY